MSRVIESVGGNESTVGWGERVTNSFRLIASRFLM